MISENGDMTGRRPRRAVNIRCGTGSLLALNRRLFRHVRLAPKTDPFR